MCLVCIVVGMSTMAIRMFGNDLMHVCICMGKTTLGFTKILGKLFYMGNSCKAVHVTNISIFLFT